MCASEMGSTVFPDLDLILERLNTVLHKKNATVRITQIARDPAFPDRLIFQTIDGDLVYAQVQIKNRKVCFRLPTTEITIPLKDILGKPS